MTVKKSILSTHTAALALAGLGALLTAGCSDNKSTASKPGASNAAPSANSAAPDAAKLKSENEQLRREVQALKAEIDDLKQTPEVLLQRVRERVSAGELKDAGIWANRLEKRYGETPQLKQARAEMAALEKKLMAQEEEARRVESMGFYALRPLGNDTVGPFHIKVESLGVGTRWSFDSNSNSSHYRDSRRGEKYVLLRTTLKNTNGDEDALLPDLAVYRIEGKEMKRIDGMEFEFRQWMSYSTFIGLHHDFKNDFSRTASVPFNAAAIISDEDAKLPLALVSSGLNCMKRTEQIGQPEVGYRRMPGCAGADTLTTKDFLEGKYRVVAYLNKPKGV